MDESGRFYYYSPSDFYTDVEILCNLLQSNSTPGPRFSKGLGIHGVPRGGVVPAVAMASRLNLRLVPELLDDRKRLKTDTPETVIVVDDIIDSGDTRKRYGDYTFLSLVGFEDEHVKGFVSQSARRIQRTWVDFWWEKTKDHSHEAVTENIVRVLQYIGEDPNRDGLKETPGRVVRSYHELFSGYAADVKNVFKVFEGGGYDQVVLLRGCPFFSMCEHHMLPFHGVAHVAYIPGESGRVIGISKLARLLEIYSRRLQIQERIGQQVTAALMENLDPLGAACILESDHMCMKMRGVNRESTMVTSSVEGVFRDKPEARGVLMSLIGK